MGFGGEVALEGDGSNIRPSADGEEDFGGGGKEGADAHGCAKRTSGAKAPLCLFDIQRPGGRCFLRGAVASNRWAFDFPHARRG